MFSGQPEGTPHFIALCFTRLCRYCVCCFIFLQIEGLWQPCIGQVYRCHFSKQICSLHISVSHFGSNSCNISEFHCYYICYGGLCLVIFGVTIAVVLGLHELCPYKTANFISKCKCPASPLTSRSPISAPFLMPPLFPKTQ